MLAALLFLFLAGLAPAGRAQQAPGDGIQKEDFFREGLAPVRKPASYDVTIVYFMDYQCPACRLYTRDVERALAPEPRVRVIYRDTPIFGPRSDAAARAAIATQFQGRHEAMHKALMRSPLPLDDAAIRAAADKAGVDWERLQHDLKTRQDDIDLLIARNFELSLATGIAGTPAFIIGNRLSNGALDYAGLRAEIADARRAAGDEHAEVTEAAAPAQEAAPAAPPELPAAESGKETRPVFTTSPAQPATPKASASPRASIGSLFAGLALALAATVTLYRRRRARKMRFDRRHPLA